MTIKHAYNLAYYKPKLWERVILHFCKMQCAEKPESMVFFKQFFNRLYVYKALHVYHYAEANPVTQEHSAIDPDFNNAGNN